MGNRKTHIQVLDYLLEDDNLDLVDAILLSKIISLHKTQKGCFISNSSLGKVVKIKDDKRISRRLSSLKKRGYIKLHYHNKHRYIVPLFKDGVVSPDNGGLSHETRGVVSSDKGGVSHETTNNISVLDNIEYKNNNTTYNTGLEKLLKTIENAENPTVKKEILKYYKHLSEGDELQHKNNLVEYYASIELVENHKELFQELFQEYI